MATIYYTGCSLDGFIATPDHSLDWLTSRDIDVGSDMGFETFAPRVGACAMGASTWRWIVENDAQGWKPKPTWVFTHRDFPASEQVRFTTADVPQVHAEMVEAAGDKDVWIVGGGDLVGQFHDVGLLDEVWVQFAPVTLGSGAPVLPRHVELRLEEVARNRDFLCGRYTVVR
ncbi:dihydrofolate reductase family protein [Knoellia sp. CPCC 206453]|uniref:dihydrofolate reductase family protein n=1 Tax=Knoellia pratensis TaxID=3404796 RepID=UPI003623B2FB